MNESFWFGFSGGSSSGRSSRFCWLIQSLKTSAFGNVPKEKGGTSENDDDQKGKDEKKEILHAGQTSGSAGEEKQKSPTAEAGGLLEVKAEELMLVRGSCCPWC